MPSVWTPWKRAQQFVRMNDVARGPFAISVNDGEIKITSGAGDLANADATTNTNKAKRARLTARL
jgi:hypothetical protein